MSKGEKIPASKLKGPLVAELLMEGILADIRSGRTRSLLYVPKVESLNAFLSNRFSITDLEYYINKLSQDIITRADLIEAAANSKAKKVRTFTGFLVNCYEPVTAILNGETIKVNPPTRTFQFINDTKHFIPHSGLTIVGVENSESFTRIEKQKHLFKNIHPLFVCRYPLNQSKDLLKWLKAINNPYLHFGDFDFAGIGIYVNEYKRYLGSRSTFFVPDNIELLIKTWGNRKLYDNQKINFDLKVVAEPKITALIDLIHTHKKGLEQEILIK
ncbi:DUF7281 domain-containing protein [Mucilaginibacter arboris]|uniref:DUF7281 domain-containing protein n=1 Tax=Mucilaginibacter arboris TaxID=2682090 RepID=UPI001E2D4FEC|nr:hypothetical protein [Mucilaginibacter arboris]